MSDHGITADNIAEVAPFLRHAANHLSECWDALAEVEKITNGEIETSDIQELVGAGDPDDMSDADLLAWLEASNA